MPIDVAGFFLLTALLLALTPGPDNLFVLSQSMAFGSRAGWLVVIGLCSGLIVHTALVALGIAALLKTSPNALLLIRSTGALYLLYLAWQSWFGNRRESAAAAQQRLSPFQLYRRGVIMNLSNPKVSLFFLAFLPQFVDVSYGSVTLQFFLLGGLFILSTIVVFGAIASMAGRYSQRINHSNRGRLLLGRVISVVFILLAANLLVEFL